VYAGEFVSVYPNWVIYGPIWVTFSEPSTAIQSHSSH